MTPPLFLFLLVTVLLFSGKDTCFAFDLAVGLRNSVRKPSNLVALHKPSLDHNNKQGCDRSTTTTDTATTTPAAEQSSSSYSSSSIQRQKQQEDFKPILIHKGRSEAMIRRAPSLAGVMLCRGWSDAATGAMISAVDRVVRCNPILTGHVYEENTLFSQRRRQLWIQPGTFPPDTHEFVRVIRAPKHVNNVRHMNETEFLQCLSRDLFPLLDTSELTSDQIRDKLPLFAVTIMILPDTDDYAMFSIKMSHAVGDGVTYFELIKQLSLAMSSNSNDDDDDDDVVLSPLDWDNPLRATHELYPPWFSPRDAEIAYGAPFLLGALKSWFQTASTRTAGVVLLEKSKVSQQKRELRELHGNNNISSNDVITAAVSRACAESSSSDVFVFTESVRGRVEGVSRLDAGNFFWEVHVPRDVCAHPDKLRRAVESPDTAAASGYKTNELPILPFLCGRVARLSSMASVRGNMIYEGVQVEYVVPYFSFLKDIPLDIAVIFRFNDQYWGIMHNFVALKKIGLLEDAIFFKES